LEGFYSIWTSPFKSSHENSDFFMKDYELLTMILSASVYRETNGSVRLYGDSDAIRYIESQNLQDLFDDGIVPISVNKAINPKVFWAAGKLESLLKADKPSVMIDLDLIIWKNLDPFFTDAEVYGIHREEIRPEIYPSPDTFKLKEGYVLPDGLDEEVLPLNTAMLYISDLDFQHLYAAQSLSFMENTAEKNENLKHMVFAEQRLLPMLAKKHEKIIKTFFNKGEDIGIQDYFTHVWGHKNILRYNTDERNKFCKRIITRIYKDYPEYIRFVEGNEIFKPYL